MASVRLVVNISYRCSVMLKNWWGWTLKTGGRLALKTGGRFPNKKKNCFYKKS